MFNRFKYSGFVPRTDLDLYANVALYQINTCIESQIKTKGTLAKVGHKYFCVVEVQFHEKTFLEETLAEDAKQAIDSTNSKIMGQISNYNSNRYDIAGCYS